MSVRARKYLLAVEIALSFWPLAAHSRVWHVRNDGTGDAPTIQAAIDSSAAGDTITLAKGIFAEQSIMRCNLKNSLVINSEAGPGGTRIVPDTAASFLSITACSIIAIDGISFMDFPGRALYFWGSSQITIANCNFLNNGHYYAKAAIFFEWCNGIDIHGCILSGNKTGIYYGEMDSNIFNYNLTFLENTACAINLLDVRDFRIDNSIISGSPYGIIGYGININVLCNNIFNNGENYAIMDFPDPTGLDGNISVDPQFCSIDPVAYNNYFLQGDSPCAPGNHPSGYPCGLIGCKPVGCASVGIEKTDWSKVKQLFK